LSGVKTSTMNKALKDIVLHENIKVTIADTNGRIKLSLTLNNINIYKIVNKTKTLLNNQEAMVFKCDMFD
jgi:aspartate carbamoyltransferase regulatory subunit